jgi:hypothetical protein
VKVRVVVVVVVVDLRAVRATRKLLATFENMRASKRPGSLQLSISFLFSSRCLSSSACCYPRLSHPSTLSHCQYCLSTSFSTTFSAIAALQTILAKSLLCKFQCDVAMSSRKSSPKRKNAGGLSAPAPAKKAKPTKKDGAKTTLMPLGYRQKANLGQKDETMLRMLCRDSKTGEERELHFRNLSHSQIDWNDAEHIAKINAWRNQIYGRAGMKAKDVTMWLPDEEAWFELYYHLSIAASRSCGMLIPKSKDVLASFNETFVEVVTANEGENVQAPGNRLPNAFASKLNRMCLGLKARLVASVYNKSGDTFVPKITIVMLEDYKQMKADLAKKGIHAESPYSDNLEEWREFMSHLPGDMSHLMSQAPKISIEDWSSPEEFDDDKQELPDKEELPDAPAEHLYLPVTTDNVMHEARKKAAEQFPNLTEEDMNAAEILLGFAYHPVVFQRPEVPVPRSDIAGSKYQDKHLVISLPADTAKAGHSTKRLKRSIATAFPHAYPTAYPQAAYVVERSTASSSPAFSTMHPFKYSNTHQNPRTENLLPKNHNTRSETSFGAPSRSKIGRFLQPTSDDSPHVEQPHLALQPSPRDFSPDVE